MEHEMETHRTVSGVLQKVARGFYGFLYEKEPDFFPSYEVVDTERVSAQH